MENWKLIPDFDYEVSDLGNVKNNKGRIIKANRHKDGYLSIQLYRNNERKQFGIHRLVAQAFIPNPENKREVNHKNKRRDDNRLENLEWSTTSENMIHSWKLKKEKGKKYFKLKFFIPWTKVKIEIKIASVG